MTEAFAFASIVIRGWKGLPPSRVGHWPAAMWTEKGGAESVEEVSPDRSGRLAAPRRIERTKYIVVASLTQQ